MNDPALPFEFAPAEGRRLSGEAEAGRHRGEPGHDRRRPHEGTPHEARPPEIRAKRAAREGQGAIAAGAREAGVRRSKALPPPAAPGRPGGDRGDPAPAPAPRKRPTLGETDRLIDALRVTRAVLRRVAARGGRIDADDAEAMRSAIAAANAALGGPA